jgi:recombination protein RecA
MAEADKAKALENAISHIEKQFGKGSIMKLGEAQQRMAVDAIPTGSIALDIAVGVGGVPRGRVTEVFGPESSGKTTLVQHVIAEAQRMGGTCAIIDAEHALDPSYARQVGVDVDNLFISQPDSAEQALEIAEALVRSAAFDVVAIDSVAALVPRAELEGEMGDSHVGLQARLMSQALRKLTGAINRSRTALIFTNQLREKVGVMFGCVPYHTEVALANGKRMMIGTIVNKKLPVEVLSLNHETGQFQARRVVNWFNNGHAEKFLKFTVERVGRPAYDKFCCTPQHPLLTPRGYRLAAEMSEGGELITVVPHFLTNEGIQVVLGSALGDGSLRQHGRHTASLRIGHGAAQDAYCAWKHGLLAGLSQRLVRNARGGLSFDTRRCYEFGRVRQMAYAGRRKDPSAEMVDALTPLAIAIWYMDDGTFDSRRQNRSSICFKGMSREAQERLHAWLEKRGITARLSHLGRLDFNVAGTHALHQMIAPYVHPSMEYKLLPAERGKFVEFGPLVRLTRRPVAMRIVSVTDDVRPQNMNRFDIEVDGTHNYVVNGVVVHNSPETTPGGRALKFYASLRLDVRRIDSIKQGTDVVGSRVKVKVVKNKVAPPFRVAEFDIMYNEGISKEGGLLDLAVELGLVKKTGAFFSYGETRLGQGRESAREFLKRNPEIAGEIERLIRQQTLASQRNAVELPGANGRANFEEVDLAATF